MSHEGKLDISHTKLKYNRDLAFANLKNDPYHWNIMVTAQILLDIGISRAMYLHQFTSGACLWRSGVRTIIVNPHTGEIRV